MCARQADREFGELAQPTGNFDCPAMLLRDDVPADRETEAGALPGRLGREERLEQFVTDFRCDAGAVVTHADLDGIGEVAAGHSERRVEVKFVATLVGSVEPVAEQVQKQRCPNAKYPAAVSTFDAAHQRATNALASVASRK